MRQVYLTMVCVGQVSLTSLRRVTLVLEASDGEAVKFESNHASGVRFHAASPVRWVRSLMAAR